MPWVSDRYLAYTIQYLSVKSSLDINRQPWNALKLPTPMNVHCTCNTNIYIFSLYVKNQTLHTDFASLCIVIYSITTYWEKQNSVPREQWRWIIFSHAWSHIVSVQNLKIGDHVWCYVYLKIYGFCSYNWLINWSEYSGQNTE